MWRHYKFCCRRYVASGCICESNELIGATPRVVVGSFCLLLLSEEAGRCSGWTISMSDANIPQQHQQHHHQDQIQHQQESGVLDGHQSHTLGNERSQLISSKAQPSRCQRNTKEHTVKPVIMSRCRTEQISFLCSTPPLNWKLTAPLQNTPHLTSEWASTTSYS